MDFALFLREFTDRHPGWTWALSRFVIVLCVCTIAASGFSGVIVLFAPFFTLEEQGLGAFAYWLWMPALGTVIWLMCSVIKNVYQAFIEE